MTCSRFPGVEGKYLITWQKLRIIRAEDNWRQTLKGPMCQAGDLATFTAGTWTWSVFCLLTLEVCSVVKLAFQLNWKLKLKKPHLHVDDGWVPEGQELPFTRGASERHTWLGHKGGLWGLPCCSLPQVLDYCEQSKAKYKNAKDWTWAELVLEYHNPSSKQWFQLQDHQVAFRKCINPCSSL